MKQNCSLFRVMLIVSLLSASVLSSQAQENGDSWEVEIIKNATNGIVRSGIVNTNSFSLEGLEYDVEYFARIRTKNTFLSDWEISDVFVLDRGAMTINSSINNVPELLLSSENGQLFILSDTLQQANIYSINGCLLRSVALSIGSTAVVELAKGLYIVNGQKIIMK
ncbi:MAG: hypothetical protein ACK5MK_02380 [Dysgonomonas sp.]